MRALLVFMLLASALPLAAQQDQSLTITSGGRERSFLVHLPSASPAPGRPLLLAFHGLGGTAAAMRFITGFNALADRHGFIVVYPQSLEIGGSRQWNVYVDDRPGHAGLGDAGAPDDIAFTREMIDELARRFSIDRSRVYATGFSNGGFMSYALSLLAPNEIAAIAPVAGNLWGDSQYLTQLAASPAVRTMPVLHIHGTADNVVRYPDADNTPQDYGEYPLFIAARACGARTYRRVEPIGPGVDRLVFCDAPVPVSLVRVIGRGHDWSSASYQTSSEIVRFFGLDAAVGHVVTDSLEPRPRLVLTDDAITLRLVEISRVTLVAPTGAALYDTWRDVGSVSISTTGLSSGMYVVRVIGGPASGTTSLPFVIVR